MSYRNSLRADRVSNRELRRRANAAIELGHRCCMILLAVLAQSGGEITVTDGTIVQVGRNLANLDFAIVDGLNKGESIVRLIEGKETQTNADNTAGNDVGSGASTPDAEDSSESVA